jgi:hypothetical protein
VGTAHDEQPNVEQPRRLFDALHYVALSKLVHFQRPILLQHRLHGSYVGRSPFRPYAQVSKRFSLGVPTLFHFTLSISTVEANDLRSRRHFGNRSLMNSSLFECILPKQGTTSLYIKALHFAPMNANPAALTARTASRRGPSRKGIRFFCAATLRRNQQKSKWKAENLLSRK